MSELLNHLLKRFSQKYWFIHEQITTYAQRYTTIHYALTLFETIFLGKAKTQSNWHFILSEMLIKLLNINLMFTELLCKSSIKQWI